MFFVLCLIFQLHFFLSSIFNFSNDARELKGKGGINIKCAETLC